MDKRSPRAIVELFHLLFLDHLGRKLDKRLYAIKGGCNLRFFFKSIRYSEDIDIDIKTIAKDTLQNKVRNLLNSQGFKQLLALKNIRIAEMTEPKQTQTTQRWKLALRSPKLSVPIHTKIEFSRRGFRGEIEFDSIDPLLIRHYQVAPFMAAHYSMNAAFQQKISALISRNQTQARDIFDLFTLITSGVDTTKLSVKLIKKLSIAIENALQIDFSDFKGQIIAYLPPENQTHYDDKTVWEDILLTVVNTLELLK